MAGYNHEFQFRAVFPRRKKRIQHQLLLRGMSAARKQGNEILPEKLHKVNPFQVRRRALVKFDVAGHSGFRLRRHREKTFPVQLRLHPDPGQTRSGQERKTRETAGIP